uniref:B30.2/SPRY domain-containing protein n=1 Tax=Erpetoichthys calabaricus TaxID=27687 RepID=A0A8C4XEI7_ERPCA
MAEAQLFVSQDEFTCSVCLDTLTDPVSLHCGHSFCLQCLTDCWDQSQESSCPQCRENFTTRPALRRNNLLNEVIKKLKKTTLSSPPPPTSQNYVGPVTAKGGQGEDYKTTSRELHVPVSTISSLVFFSLLSDFCPLTLDINTANRVLHLSEGYKKVTCEGTKTEYPDHPDRFVFWPQVLCREALTGTRCYWEVECSGDFMMIGVAYKGLSRRGRYVECSLGNNDKSWCLQCSHSQYSLWYNKQQTVISAPYSPRIGVYLDWPAGSLSFYSVSHTMTLLHRFNVSFTEPLYPGFWLNLHCSGRRHLRPTNTSLTSRGHC